MFWQRYVTWASAALASVTGVAYFGSIAREIRVVSLDQLHWDPRILLLIAALVWLIGSVLIGVLAPHRRTPVMWVLGLAGVAGVGSGLTGFGLSLALMLSPVLPVFAILSLRARGNLSAFVMTSSNPYPEATVRWFDWFYSDEGSTAVYMVNEDFYTVESDGSLRYTDEVIEADIGFEKFIGSHTIFSGGGAGGWFREKQMAPGMQGTPMLSYIEKTGG